VYIKYATWDAPADGGYDDSAVSVKTDSMITAIFSGLKAGDYYITVRGYDSSTHIPTYVQGGTHLIFESEDVIIANVPARKP
jgi:hypothetical protein